MSTALSELTSLMLHRPSPDAEPTVLATWFDRLARVHAHLADEAHDREAVYEWQLSLGCRKHAIALRNPTTTEGVQS